MILTPTNICKSFGIQQILNNISITLSFGQRMGLIGANGVGKSTFLKIIVGEIEPDSGEIVVKPGTAIGYLPQVIREFHGKTIDELIRESQRELQNIQAKMSHLEEEMATTSGDMLSEIVAEYGDLAEQFERRGGYEIDYRIDTVIEGLRLSHIPRDREVETLSGGEKTRVGLASFLLQSPDLLLLDEPTNYLDFATLQWLEGYLQQHQGGLLVSSHDRQFLNQTVDTIVEIDEHSRQLQTYPGDYYDAYLLIKATERRKWEEEYERQRTEIHDLKKALHSTARNVGHNRSAPVLIRLLIMLVVSELIKRLPEIFEPWKNV